MYQQSANQLGAINQAGSAQAQSQGWGLSVPAREAEIPAELLSLSREIEELATFAAAVEDKISPILQPRCPSECATAGQTPYRTELGGQLASYTERVAEVRRRLQSILGRAEI